MKHAQTVMIDIWKEDGDLSCLDCSTIFRRCVKRHSQLKIGERQLKVSLEGMHIQPPYFSAGLTDQVRKIGVHQIPCLKVLQVQMFGKFLKETIVLSSTSLAEAVLTPPFSSHHLGSHLFQSAANKYKKIPTYLRVSKLTVLL